MTQKPPKSLPTKEQWEWFESHLTSEVRTRLYREAYRILENKQDAEDVMQDAYRIGISNLSNLRDTERFFSWMFKIVRREAYHHLYRENKLKTAKMRLMLFKEHYIASTTPEKLLITKDEYERLRREIEQMKSPEKEILLLKLTTDKSLKQIADELGLNYHTTRSKFNRARILIKHRMNEDGGDDSHEKS